MLVEKLSTRVIHIVMYPVRSVPEAVRSVTRNNSYTLADRATAASRSCGVLRAYGVGDSATAATNATSADSVHAIQAVAASIDMIVSSVPAYTDRIVTMR